MTLKNKTHVYFMPGMCANPLIFERIKLGGVGSPKYFILKTDIKITNLLNLDNNTNQCNIELRPKGIIISFRSLLETYGLVIPYYKLKLFKGQSNVYSIYIDEYFIKILANKKNEHEFIKKLNKFKSTN